MTIRLCEILLHAHLSEENIYYVYFMEVNTFISLRVINRQHFHTDIVCFGCYCYLACSLKSDQISFWVCKSVEPEPDVFCFNLHVQNVLQCSNVSRMFYLWSQIITGCDLKMRLDENSQRLLCFTVPHNRDVDPVWLPAFVSGVFLALLIFKPYFTEPPIS